MDHLLGPTCSVWLKLCSPTATAQVQRWEWKVLISRFRCEFSWSYLIPLIQAPSQILILIYSRQSFWSCNLSLYPALGTFERNSPRQQTPRKLRYPSMSVYTYVFYALTPLSTWNNWLTLIFRRTWMLSLGHSHIQICVETVFEKLKTL
jgi:hypothetical protein